MNLSENFIEDVQGLADQYIPNSKEIDLSNNNLVQFPKMHLSKLLWLNLSSNKIEELSNFEKSFVPKLRKLSISDNKIEKIPEI